MNIRPDNGNIAKNLIDEIVGKITSGQIKPGEKLPAERQLAEDYEISRASVREALRALEALGAVQIRHGGGAYVVNLNEIAETGMRFVFSITAYDTDIDAIVDFRKMLELEAVRLAIRNCRDFRRMRLLFDTAQANMNTHIEREYFKGCIQYDRVFHEIIVAETGNRLLQMSHQASIAAFEQKTGAGFISLTTNSKKKDWIIMQKMHDRLADAIVTANTALALTLMREHIELVRFELATNL